MKILIIKLGAKGDVLRTTPLLHALKGDVFWVTKKECKPLLKQSNKLKKIINLNNAEKELKGTKFDLLISLDDDRQSAALASKIQSTSLIGSFLDPYGNLSYTESSKNWFDMSLISKLGKAKADYLKKNNNSSYQKIIFKIIGKKFTGQEYILNFKGNIKEKQNKKKEKIVGIESRAGKRWPTKKWNKYPQLGKALSREGKKVIFFKRRRSINQYIGDINKCDLIVTGDTLALHIALALKVKVVAIFTCTSPAEIYSYNRMTKIVSPALAKAFYKTTYVKKAVDTLSLQTVFDAVKKYLF